MRMRKVTQSVVPLPEFTVAISNYSHQTVDDDFSGDFARPRFFLLATIVKPTRSSRIHTLLRQHIRNRANILTSITV